MSREKQIEEMAYIVAKKDVTCRASSIALALYNAGYRKQSEGEWQFLDGDLGYDEYGCSACGESVIFSEEEDKYAYCPNCGAKMKGGAE